MNFLTFAEVLMIFDTCSTLGYTCLFVISFSPLRLLKIKLFLRRYHENMFLCLYFFTLCVRALSSFQDVRCQVFVFFAVVCGAESLRRVPYRAQNVPHAGRERVIRPPTASTTLGNRGQG